MDIEEFIEKFDPYYRPLEGYIARITNDVNLAEEITQEIYRMAFADPLYFLQYEDIGALMRHIAVNKITDMRRHNKHKNEVMEKLKVNYQMQQEQQDLEGIFDILEKREMQKVLKEAMDQLQEPYRRIIILRYGYGLGMNEVAAMMNANYSTTLYRRTKALKLLRKSLEKQGIHSNDVTLRFLLFMVFRQ